MDALYHHHPHKAPRLARCEESEAACLKSCRIQWYMYFEGTGMLINMKEAQRAKIVDQPSK
jgi:hypothetical protein